MENFTIIIFGYGETQISGLGFGLKVATSSLNNAQPLIDGVWNLKPSGSQANQKFHAIVVYSYKKINYMAKDGYSVETNNSLITLIDNLKNELKNIHDNLPVNP